MLAILLSFGASETAEREALVGPHQPEPTWAKIHWSL
jgi:hypothetical protein